MNDRTAADPGARRVLDTTRALIDPRLRAAVRELSPPLPTVLGYHFGWCDEHGRATDQNAGKAIRPALVLAAARAAGGTPATAVDTAVAVELAHNFSLLHDDVIDADTTRRHRPTVWAVFGVPTAILAGDALLALAEQVLSASARPAAERAVATLTASVQDMIGGQFTDLAFEARADVGMDECLQMAAGKTAALIECACVLGASCGPADPVTTNRLGGFGRHLGMAFQLVDDLLGIWGDPRVTGKPVWSDLHARKKSLPVVAALTAGGGASGRLADMYADDGPVTDEQLAVMARLVAEAGGREWAEARARQEIEEATSCLTAANTLPRGAADLLAIAHIVLQGAPSGR